MTECKINANTGPFLCNVGFFWVMTLGPDLINLAKITVIYSEILCAQSTSHTPILPPLSLPQKSKFHHDPTVLLTFSGFLSFLSWIFVPKFSCLHNSILMSTFWKTKANECSRQHYPTFPTADKKRVCFIEDTSRKILEKRKILENLLLWFSLFCRSRVLKSL